MSAQKGLSLKEKSQRKKALYSSEFQEMLDKLEEEDYADVNRQIFNKKSRLCLEKVKALEKHFEVENKLQPDRKMKIAEEVGLEPRQVAIWFQNRRARWKSKQLEREYDHLRASYDDLKHDYGSLEQEKVALLEQLNDLKAKIEARNQEILTSMNDNTSMNVPLSASSVSSSSTTFDPFSMVSSSPTMDDFQFYKPYQDHSLRMEDVGMLNNAMSCNFFSVDQAPTLQWYHGTDQYN